MNKSPISVLNGNKLMRFGTKEHGLKLGDLTLAYIKTLIFLTYKVLTEKTSGGLGQGSLSGPLPHFIGVIGSLFTTLDPGNTAKAMVNSLTPHSPQLGPMDTVALTRQ